MIWLLTSGKRLRCNFYLLVAMVMMINIQSMSGFLTVLLTPLNFGLLWLNNGGPYFCLLFPVGGTWELKTGPTNVNLALTLCLPPTDFQQHLQTLLDQSDICLLQLWSLSPLYVLGCLGLISSPVQTDPLCPLHTSTTTHHSGPGPRWWFSEWTPRTESHHHTSSKSDLNMPQLYPAGFYLFVNIFRVKHL